jgi:hypothetical protein
MAFFDLPHWPTPRGSARMFGTVSLKPLQCKKEKGERGKMEMAGSEIGTISRNRSHPGIVPVILSRAKDLRARRLARDPSLRSG